MFAKKAKKRAESAPADDKGRPTLPTEFAPLVDRAGHHIQALQAGHSGIWKMEEANRFDVDLSGGQISWEFDDKVVRAPAQLLGTWNPHDETFLWAWDHPSAPPGTAIAAAAVRDHAESNGITELTTPTIRCGFDECYPIAGTAVLVGDLQGIYRFDAGGPWAYIGFGNVTLAKQ